MIQGINIFFVVGFLVPLSRSIIIRFDEKNSFMEIFANMNLNKKKDRGSKSNFTIRHSRYSF